MKKTLRYYIKSVYGKPTRYPVDPEIIESLRLFNGQKTLENKDIKAYVWLGYTVEVVEAPREICKSCLAAPINLGSCNCPERQPIFGASFEKRMKRNRPILFPM
jgi:hypothetical protein